MTEFFMAEFVTWINVKMCSHLSHDIVLSNFRDSLFPCPIPLIKSCPEVEDNVAGKKGVDDEIDKEAEAPEHYGRRCG
eukprot:SAG31_NODE_765_length_12248_cov_6.802947_16_plen_78_part_00